MVHKHFEVAVQVGAGKEHHVTGCCELTFGRKTVRIHKMCVEHAQRDGLGIHHVHEILFRASDESPARLGSVIA